MSQHIIRRARALRRDATEAEKTLWRMLRSRGLEGAKFRRQHPIGPFIVDFACPTEKLIIEADGEHHAENAADERRTAWLEAQGWRVQRLWNNEILENPEGVMVLIESALCGGPSTTTPLPTLSPEKGERA